MKYPGALYSALAGNMGALIVGGVVAAILTMIKPDKEFNWESTRALNNADHFILAAATKSVPLPQVTTPEDREKLSGNGNATEKSQQVSTVKELPVVESSYDLVKGVEHVLTDVLGSSHVTYSSISVCHLLECRIDTYLGAGKFSVYGVTSLPPS